MNTFRFLGASCASSIACAMLCSTASAQSVGKPDNNVAPNNAANTAVQSQGGAPTGSLPGTSIAQTAARDVNSDAPSTTMPEIIVTGTSIRGAAPVGANLTTVGQDQIQSTPAQSIQQILTSVPAVSGLGAPGQGGFQSNDRSGADIPSIHGLGGSSSTSTLSLIDGHRIPLTGTIHSLADPSVIPPNAIARVEVLTGGASSIYGSDAIAGVINFITRQSYDGVQASAQTGFGDHYRTHNANVLAGKTWDSGSVYIAYNYSYRSDLLALYRPYTRHDRRSLGGSNLASFACEPASIQPAGSSVIYGYPYDGSGVPNKQEEALCDYSYNTDLLPKEIRNQGMIKGFQDIGDNLTLEIDAVYSSRRNDASRSRGSITGTIYGPGSGRGSQINPFYQFIPGSTATSQTVRMNFDDLLGPGAHDEAGDETFYVHANAEYRINDNWRFTADGVVGVDTSFSRRIGDVCSSCADLALNGTTNGAGDPTKPSVPSSGLIVTQPLTIANALDPYNLASSNRTSAAVLNDLRDSVEERRSRQGIQDLKLQLGGTLFDLPAGPVKISIGAEAAKYSLYTEKFSPLNIGPSSTGTATGIFPFPDRKVISAFAEALLPIVSPDMDIPAVRSLTVNISGRYDHYNDFGGTTNPRFAVDWEVLDGLKLRADYSRSFVAPQVVFQGIDGNGLNSESGYGLSTSVVNLPVADFPEAAQLPGCANVSVCTLGSAITGLQLNGGQPLVAETGKTYSFGTDITPIFAPGLRLSATYWYNEFHGGNTAPIQALAVGTPSLFSRYHFYPNGATPEQISELVGEVPQLTAVPANVYYIYDFRIGNVLNLFVSGLDVDVNYSFATDFGHFRIGSTFTKLLQFDQQTGDGARFSVLDTDGFNSTFPSVDLVGRVNLGWSIGNFSFDGYLNYVDRYHNYSGNTVIPIKRDADGNPIGGGDKVRSNATVDIHLAYSIPELFEETQVFMDVQNLFDRDPAPFNDRNGYDQFYGNPIGRLVTLGLRTTF